MTPHGELHVHVSRASTEDAAHHEPLVPAAGRAAVRAVRRRSGAETARTSGPQRGGCRRGTRTGSLHRCDPGRTPERTFTLGTSRAEDAGPCWGNAMPTAVSLPSFILPSAVMTSAGLLALHRLGAGAGVSAAVLLAACAGGGVALGVGTRNRLPDGRLLQLWALVLVVPASIVFVISRVVFLIARPWLLIVVGPIAFLLTVRASSPCTTQCRPSDIPESTCSRTTCFASIAVAESTGFSEDESNRRGVASVKAL